MQVQDEIEKSIIKSGSSPSSQCQENKGIGYFKGDLDDIPEPLVILPKNLIKDDSIIGVGATTKDNIQTNVTKQELPTTTTPTKPNVTKQELPTTTPTKTFPTIKNQELKTSYKTNVTKEELPTTTTKLPTTTKKQQQLNCRKSNINKT